MSLDPGAPMPAFSLPTDGGAALGLADAAGKPLVIFLYAEIGSSSCSNEVRSFQALLPDFTAAGAQVWGLSPDSPERLAKFRAKEALTIDLLSDESRETISAWGFWIEKSMYGRTFMGVERATLLVAGDGRIVQVWHKVRVKGHAEEVLAAVRAL